MKTKKNPVSSKSKLFNSIYWIFLDEDDDLSEGDVSADPVEGIRLDLWDFVFSNIFFSFQNQQKVKNVNVVMIMNKMTMLHHKRSKSIHKSPFKNKKNFG